MNRLLLCGIAATVLLLGMNACTYNDEETLFPQTTPPYSCNISVASFTDDVVPILENKCNGCHSEQNAPFSGASIVLEGHANVKTYADNGRLSGAVNHEVPFSPMPRGGSQLPACELEAINKWIEAGSPDN